MTQITELKYDQLVAGERLEPLKKAPITKAQLVDYAQASGDLNPLHTDDAFAQKMGMDGVIAHGMLIMGFLGQYIQELAGTTADIAHFKMRFGAMTRPGDAITCVATVDDCYTDAGKKYVSLKLQATKPSEEVVGSGYAVLCFG